MSRAQTDWCAVTEWCAVAVMAMAQLLGLVFSTWLAWGAASLFSAPLSLVVFAMLWPVIGTFVALGVGAIVFGLISRRSLET